MQRVVDKSDAMDRNACVFVLSWRLVVYTSMIKSMWIEACVFMYVCVELVWGRATGK